MFFLLRHLRVKKHLQQQVSEFAGEFRPIAIINGFQHLVGFFQGVALDGVKGLLAVPRAPARSAQPGHDGDSFLVSFTSSHRINLSSLYGSRLLPDECGRKLSARTAKAHYLPEETRLCYNSYNSYRRE